MSTVSVAVGINNSLYRYFDPRSDATSRRVLPSLMSLSLIRTQKHRQGRLQQTRRAFGLRFTPSLSRMLQPSPAPLLRPNGCAYACNCTAEFGTFGPIEPAQIVAPILVASTHPLHKGRFMRHFMAGTDKKGEP